MKKQTEPSKSANTFGSIRGLAVQSGKYGLNWLMALGTNFRPRQKA